MSEKFIDEIRKIPSLTSAILSSVTLYEEKKTVEVKIITDKIYSAEDESAAKKVVRSFVPDFFSCSLIISKLTPDEEMVAKKIFSYVEENDRQLASLLTSNDIKVQRTEDGFYFEISVVDISEHTNDFIKALCEALQRCYCGKFSGKCLPVKNIEDIHCEEKRENVEYVIPTRYFNIENFSAIEGSKKPETAVYMADLNFITESVVICGVITDIRERTDREKPMFNFTVYDGTASVRVGYFPRQRSIEKIRKLKVGESVVLTCRTKLYHDMFMVTAVYIDYGSAPQGFVPEKRASKPVPKYYQVVFPEKYTDFTQDNLFVNRALPDCLTQNKFVVFDLETTGLNSSPSSGNMDRIIEIGAYKIIGGEIKESFSTFVNPCKKLSQEIVGLTGINQSMVDGAPTYEQVMPDFFKFINGCYLVGHNAANFDYKFIDYYCNVCGYSPERKIFDTLVLSQQLLKISNFKLNTVAAYFGITFNHHRAVDDALATAKIFIELLKLKKCLPTPC